MSSYKYYEDDDERDTRTGHKANTFVDCGHVYTRGSDLEEEMTDAGKTTPSKPAYKYNEGKLLEEIRKYIDATYGEHYSQNKYQATEFIIDGGHGTGFCIGNVLKYAQRYGHKGNPTEWRKDLMKVIHYAIIQLYVHDLEHKGN